jgi:hypothetical protein
MGWLVSMDKCWNQFILSYKVISTLEVREILWLAHGVVKYFDFDFFYLCLLFFCSITYFQKIQEWNYNPRFGLNLIMSALLFSYVRYISSLIKHGAQLSSHALCPLQGCKKWGDLYCELAGWSTDFHIFIVSI